MKLNRGFQVIVYLGRTFFFRFNPKKKNNVVNQPAPVYAASTTNVAPVAVTATTAVSGNIKPQISN